MNQHRIHSQFIPPQPDYMDAQQHFLHSWNQFAHTRPYSTNGQCILPQRPILPAPTSSTGATNRLDTPQNRVQAWKASTQRQQFPVADTEQATIPSRSILPTTDSITTPLSELLQKATKIPRKKKKKVAAHHTFSCSLANSSASRLAVKTTNSLTLQELLNVLRKRLTSNKLMERPIFSYSFLIALSLLSSPENQLTLSGICQWITEAFPYFKYSRSVNWRNSIRHNLSLNGAFQKTTKSSDGKSHLWTFQKGNEGKYFKDLDISFEELRVFLQKIDQYLRPAVYAKENVNHAGVITYSKANHQYNMGNTYHQENNINNSSNYNPNNNSNHNSNRVLITVPEQKKVQRHTNYLPTPPLTDNTPPPRKGSLIAVPQITTQASSHLDEAINRQQQPDIRVQDVSETKGESAPMTLLRPISVKRVTAPVSIVVTSTPNHEARPSIDASGKVRSIDEHLDLLKTPQFGDNIHDSILRMPMISPRRMDVVNNGFGTLNSGEFRIDSLF